MKIIVISSTIFPVSSRGLVGYGGLEQIALQCAKGLAEKGHQVSLVTPDGSSCDGVEIIPTGPPGQHDEREAYGGYPEHKEGEIVRRRAHAGYWQHLLSMDAIIDHSWQKWAYMLKAEGTLKVPILGVMHAPVNTMYGKLPPVEKPCVVCISKDQGEHFKALFNQEVRIAYNGIDLDFYKPVDVPRTNRFLFLARFSSIKGADLAIDACRNAGLGLDLVGDTSITHEPDYYYQCKSKCDGKQIRMVGPANRGECVYWFSQAHCFLHPNMRFREPFGLAPVEAMACGLPVIAWDNGAMRETIHPDCGGLVNSFDGLVKAIEVMTRGDVDRMRPRCREWASQFSVQKMIDRYESLCVEAIEGGGW